MEHPPFPDFLMVEHDCTQIYYEIDEDEVKTSLRADEYDGDCEGS